MTTDFEPPKYLASLIAAINDAAKAAQTSALFLLGLGLYLVATVISTTDEDLLRGTAVQVAQLGVRAPVAIAYALAPAIFLFLHVHTLIRFDILAANLRLFAADLPRAVPLEADRERTRALLAKYFQSTELQAAKLSEAQLQGAILAGAQLQGADLSGAQLQGTSLFLARLQGADLSGGRLEGADLRGCLLWQTVVHAETNLGLADLRGASWQPIGEEEKARLREIINAFRNDRQEWAKERLERLIAPAAAPDHPPIFALDGVLLVDEVDDPQWQQLDRARLTTDEHAYDEALVPFLADLARGDAHVARDLTYRVSRFAPFEEEKRNRRCPRRPRAPVQHRCACRTAGTIMLS